MSEPGGTFISRTMIVLVTRRVTIRDSMVGRVVKNGQIMICAPPHRAGVLDISDLVAIRAC
jgi:hypothetical protein